MTWWIVFSVLCAALLFTIWRKSALRFKVLAAIPLTLAALAALLVAAGAGLDMAGSGLPRFVRLESYGAQAARVEADRQKQQTANSELAPGETPVAAAALNAAPAPAPAETAATAPNVWTDFRGPKRDGGVTDPILTACPGGKLTQLWRPPVGGGWSPMVIADRLLYTIQQTLPQAR